MAEMLGSRHQTRPATIAACPHSKLLAVAPKAGHGDGVRSQLEFVRLWKAVYDPLRGRHLEVLASIPVADGGLHRLVWSWNSDSSAYGVGLLAGGFDGGVVSVWNPAHISYFNASAGSCLFDLPQVNKPTNVDIKKIVSKMSREVEHIYMDQLDEAFDGWHIVEENCKDEVGDWELINMKPAALLEHKSSGEITDHEGPYLLKIVDLEGPVRGLGFNNQYPNMLAAAGKTDRLNIYHIDYPVRDTTSKYEFADGSEKAKNARVTFLEWHPHYPAMLASSSDAGITIWDIRDKKPLLRLQDKNEHCTEVRWRGNGSLEFAVSSIGESSDTVKIWDIKRTRNNFLQDPMFAFGPKKGVTTLSWSSAHDLILTTDVGGEINCWSVDGKKRVDLCGEVPGSLEARWCETKHEFVVSTLTSVKLCKLLKLPVAT